MSTGSESSAKKPTGLSRLLLTVFFILFCTIADAHAAPFAYIANNNADTVSVIDTATNSVVATIPVGTEPKGAAVNLAGTKVYVVNNFSLPGNGPDGTWRMEDVWCLGHRAENPFTVMALNIHSMT